jgi:hypothetical protein
MATIICAFCGYKWDERLLSLNYCPCCEYADTPDMFHIVDWSDEEVFEIWNILENSFVSMKAKYSDTLATLFIPKTEDRPWEKLVLQILISDHILVCEVWKQLFSGRRKDLESYLSVLMALFDAGLLSFVDDPETLPRTLHMIDDKKQRRLADLVKIAKSDRFIDLYEILGSPTETPSITNYWLLDKFAQYQTSFILRNDEISRRLCVAYSKSYPRGRGPSLRLIITQANRFQALAVLLDTQLSLHHDMINPLLAKYPAFQKSGIVNEFIFDNKFLFVPSIRSVNSLLEIRDAPEFRRLRTTLSVSRNLPPDDFIENLKDIRAIIDDSVNMMNKKFATLSEITEISISGLAATAGSLLGGLPGAIVGGIGGVALGKISGDASEHLLKKVNRNWTMLISRFKRD